MMGEPKTPSNSKVLRLNFSITFLGFLDTHMLIPVMALYAWQLGATPAMVGLVIGLYSITNTPANVLFGRIVDRVGHKIPLILGLLGDALSMFFYVLCRTPWHLALVRMFHGMSGGMVGPATMSITARHSSPANKGKAMGFYGMAMGLSTLVGYGASGLLSSRIGYHSLFFLGSALSGIGTVLAVIIPIKKSATDKASRSSSAQDFQKIAKLLKRKGLTASYCAIFAQYFAFGGVVTLLPLYVRSLGLEAFHVGMLLATFSLAFLVFQFASGTLSDRAGRKIPTALGLGLEAIVLVVLPHTGTFAILAAIMVLYGIAYALLFPSISALITDCTTPEEYGKATGIFHALLTAGVAIGAPVIGWGAERIGLEAGITLTPAVLVLALIIVLLNLRGTIIQAQPDLSRE